jgi:hypothetical protein
MEVKLCECQCGQPAPIASVTSTRKGNVKGKPLRFVNGHQNRIHRMSHSPEERAYNAAKSRCLNPKAQAWKDYGGRGIEFRFTSFQQFFAELGPRPEGMSLDRKDNDGHYEPGNVRWATPAVQLENRRSYRPRKKTA